MLNQFKIDGNVLIVFNRKDNREILCDATDYDIVSQYTWSLNNRGYVKTDIKDASGKRKILYLHRLLMNPPADMEVDHINGITHDNSRSNLRIVSKQVNQHNQRSAKGYYWKKSLGKYQAQIKLNNKLIYLGLYNTEDEARTAYLDAKKIYHPTAPINATVSC